MSAAHPTPTFWEGRRVLVTGHTGFKGSWLCLWLQYLGATVHGVALPPTTRPDMFSHAQVGKGMTTQICDIRDMEGLKSALHGFRPEIVLHLAAQALVRESYNDPVGTFATNVMGTIHLLEAVRAVESVIATVIVTSDKCYDNREQSQPYSESAPMGGHDPYSASKGCAELVTASYARSFFTTEGASLGGICTGRAGNVIGGGDWARDRLVPDLIRAFTSGKQPIIRRPGAVRPWQHVLEPLSGYLMLAEATARGRLPAWSGGWNFGPMDEDARSVSEICAMVSSLWGKGTEVIVDEDPTAPHEANLLSLDSTRAHHQLNWRPRWRLADALRHTVAWYQAHAAGADLRALTMEQIASYSANADVEESTKI